MSAPPPRRRQILWPGGSLPGQFAMILCSLLVPWSATPKTCSEKVQFVAIRRVLLHPDMAAPLRLGEADLFLQDCHTWRIAGTMLVEGYPVAQRLYKTTSIEALLRAALILQ